MRILSALQDFWEVITTPFKILGILGRAVEEDELGQTRQGGRD